LEYKIVLGSSSPWRAEMMREMGLDFEVMIPGVDEKSIRHPDPQKLVSALARFKARAIIPRLGPGIILITSDQVAVCNGRIREKPKNMEQGRRFLRTYRDYPMTCINAVYAYNTTTRRDRMVHSTATVWFKNLSETEIDHILRRTPALQCAGGCAAGHPTFKKYEDRVFGGKDDLYGLPQDLTRKMISQLSAC
jgi:septum formation protein